ncbi:MATE family efflux transporter [Microvirga sp. TS319]|uniref:MATE family efflux transporter n=1 Tax=Microvirga sp. TS319 TaxID=3241165 RepID=UPI00351A39D8
MSDKRSLSFEVSHHEILRIALPMMLAHLSTPLVGLVATGVVGRAGDAALIGGVALASVIFDVVFVSCNFLRGATTGFTAQAVGAGNRTEEQSMLLGAFVIAVGVGVTLVLLRRPIGILGLEVLGASGAAAEAARGYFTIRIWSAPFVLFNYVAFGWILGRGEAFLGLMLQTLLNGLGIALSLWWVLYLGWGLEGAALASVVAEAVTTAVGLVLVITRTSAAHWNPVGIWNTRRLRRLAAVNSDMMVRSLALLLGISFFTRQSAAMGIDILAANTILLRFYSVAISFLDGMATAAEQLAGRAVGARYRPAFDQMVRLTTGWGVGIAAGISFVIALTGGLVIDWMGPSTAVKHIAHEFLPWAVFLPLAGAVAFQMDGIFIGATWSREMRNMMLLSLAIYLAAWAVLTPAFGNHGLWMSFLIFLGARSIAFRLWMRRLVPRTFP